MPEMTSKQVHERERVMRLRPVEADFKGRKGYERRYNPDGSYRWRYRYKPNDGHGKTTREFNEVAEMLKPFQRADVERVQNMPAGPALTDQTARSRGRSHAGRAGGNRVERGIDGELMRETPDGGREPTGRWCLGAPGPWMKRPKRGRRDGTMRITRERKVVTR